MNQISREKNIFRENVHECCKNAARKAPSCPILSLLFRSSTMLSSLFAKSALNMASKSVRTITFGAENLMDIQTPPPASLLQNQALWADDAFFKHHSMHANSTNASFAVKDPSTLQFLGECPDMGAEEAEAAIEKAHEALSSFRV